MQSDLLSPMRFQQEKLRQEPDPGPAKEALQALLLYLAVFLILFSPVLFSGQLFAPDDGLVQNQANFLGKMSLWSLGIYSGFPLVADPIGQHFYPLPLILAHLPQGWNIYIVLGYVLTGTFINLYIRMLTGSRFASLMGGMFFSLSGYLMCETIHVHIIQVAMWFAACLAVFEYLAGGRKGRNEVIAFGVIAICGCALNGQFQTLAYMLGVLGLYAPWRSLAIEGKRQRFQYIGTCYTILVLGLAMSAVQLLPTAELAAFSVRKQFSFQDFLTYDMHPLEAFGVFLPFLFGGAPDGIISQPYFASFVCPPHFLYLGFIPLFLSTDAVWSLRRNRLIWFWAAAATLTFFLSFGDFTPLANILYHMPLFGSFRCLHRILLVTALANSILAALTVASLEKAALPAKRLIVPSATIVMIFAGVLIVVSTLQGVLSGQAIKYGIKSLGVLPWTNPAIGSSTVLFILSTMALLAFVRCPAKMWSKYLLAAVTIADLSFLGWYAQGGQWRLHSADPAKIEPPPTAQKYVPLAQQNYNRILTVRGGSAGLDEMPNNLCRLWNVPSASGYSPLIMSRYGNMLNMSEGGFLFPPLKYSARDRCFDLLSVKYATTEAGDDRLEKIADEHGVSPWHKVETIGAADIHENSRLMPRAWLAREVLKLDAAAILNAIKTSTLPDGRPFDPYQTALVEEKIELPSGGALFEALKIARLDHDYIKLEVTASRPSILVLSDIFYPWWRASEGGKDLHIYRVDYVLRGLVLSAGDHTIEFKLQPNSLYLGTFISALSLLVLGGTYLLLKRRSKSPASSSKTAAGD